MTADTKPDAQVRAHTLIEKWQDTLGLRATKFVRNDMVCDLLAALEEHAASEFERGKTQNMFNYMRREEEAFERGRNDVLARMPDDKVLLDKADEFFITGDLWDFMKWLRERLADEGDPK